MKPSPLATAYALIADEPDTLAHRALQLAIVLLGSTVLYAVASYPFWVGALVLSWWRSGRAVAAPIPVMFYAPFCTVIMAFAIASLTRHRLAPLVATLSLVPVRTVALMWFVPTGPLPALAIQAPMATVEFTGSAVAIALAVSPLGRVGKLTPRSALALTAVAATVAGSVCVILGVGHLTYLVLDDLRVLRSLPLPGDLAEVLPIFFTLGISLIPMAGGAAVWRPGGFVASWTGAVAGSTLYGIGVAAVFLATTPYYRVGDVMPLLVAMLLPAVVIGMIAVPGSLVGSALRWLAELATEAEELDDRG